MSYISIENVTKSERMHFLQCPMCSQWFDKRESKQFSHHVHGLHELTRTLAIQVKLNVENYQDMPGVLSFG